MWDVEVREAITMRQLACRTLRCTIRKKRKTRKPLRKDSQKGRASR